MRATTSLPASNSHTPKVTLPSQPSEARAAAPRIEAGSPAHLAKRPSTGAIGPANQRRIDADIEDDAGERERSSRRHRRGHRSREVVKVGRRAGRGTGRPGSPRSIPPARPTSRGAIGMLRDRTALGGHPRRARSDEARDDEDQPAPVELPGARTRRRAAPPRRRRPRDDDLPRRRVNGHLPMAAMDALGEGSRRGRPRPAGGPSAAASARTERRPCGRGSVGPVGSVMVHAPSPGSGAFWGGARVRTYRTGWVQPVSIDLMQIGHRPLGSCPSGSTRRGPLVGLAQRLAEFA